MNYFSYDMLCAGAPSDSFCQLVATVVHSDLHSTQCLQALQQTVDCSLTLASAADSNSVHALHCSTVIKRLSGKVLTAVRYSLISV